MSNSSHLLRLQKKKEQAEAVHQKFFATLTQALHTLEKEGGEIRILSKDAINSVLHNEVKNAGIALVQAEKKLRAFQASLRGIRTKLGGSFADMNLRIKDLQNAYSQLQALENDFASAREEFYEAKILHEYLRSGKKKVLSPEALPLVDFEAYAGALSDFCGELVRRARLDIMESEDPVRSLNVYLHDMQEIYQSLSRFAFSNKSGIRTKLEHLKGYILRLEELIFERRS